jgi:DNA-binding FadR family transcriptional regulator
MFLKVNPIRRSELVAKQLIAKICNDRMRTGDKLPTEREIANAMNVSRNTLREAIATLQLMGVLEVKRSSGIFISNLPANDDVVQSIKHVLTQNVDPQTAIDARIAMEPGAAILASQVASPEEWEGIDKCITVIKQSVHDNNLEQYILADNNLHKAIVLATQNETLISTLIPILDTVRQPLWRMMKQNIYNDTVLQRSLEEHIRIYEAMRSKEEYYIFRAVRHHLESSKARLANEFAAIGD